MKDSKVTPDLSLLVYFGSGYNALPQDRFASSLFAGEFIRTNAGFRGATADEIGKMPECGGISRSLRISDRFAGIFTTAPAKKAENAFRIAALTVTDPFLPQAKVLQQMKDKKLESLSEPKKMPSGSAKPVTRSSTETIRGRWTLTPPPWMAWIWIWLKRSTAGSSIPPQE